MLKVLFICSQNRLRSPTAEQIFRGDPRLDVRSAGVDRDAKVVVSSEVLEWAEIVFVMENRHRNVLRRRFKKSCDGKRMICIRIPDEYDFMDPELVRLLRERVLPILDHAENRDASES